MLAGVILALAIAIPSLEGINWNTVQKQFEDAIWGWALLAAVLYPLIPIAWATALMGCVNQDLPFVPTALTQLACSFLNLITPNGIGGTALQLDYLHKQGVPVASGGSAMVLSTGVGGAIQMALFLIAAAITATAVDTSSSSSDNTSLYAIAIVAALVGIVLFVPKIRGKVVPAVKRAASDIWAVIRTPKKAMQLFGGDLAGNLLYPALLGLCLLAFHQRLDYAQLVVRAGRGRNARQRGAGARWHRRAGSRAHRGLDELRDPGSTGTRDGARVPRHHVRDPAVLRVLHPALAASPGLRVSSGSR